jgi:DNA invertase Pin-like site-specific DNA recombinase
MRRVSATSFSAAVSVTLTHAIRVTSGDERWEVGPDDYRTRKWTGSPLALVGYARVSTLDQDPTMQLDALAAAGCTKVFEDRASGARADRPGLQKALHYVRDGDVLIVWKLDWLGRSLPHLIETVSALEKRGVGFRSLTEAIDTTTPGGRLVFHLFGALGQFERDLIRERTRAGLAAAATRGRKGGRKPVITAEKLKRAREIVGKGLTVREVAMRSRWERPPSMTRCASEWPGSAFVFRRAQAAPINPQNLRHLMIKMTWLRLRSRHLQLRRGKQIVSCRATPARLGGLPPFGSPARSPLPFPSVGTLPAGSSGLRPHLQTTVSKHFVDL